MTIKGIAQLIFDYADDYNIDIPLRHAKKFHDIIVDNFDHKNFMIIVNGSIRSSWPEVIVNEKSLSDEEIQNALKFFEEAGANVMAYKNNGVETIIRIPRRSENYFSTELANNYFKPQIL